MEKKLIMEDLAIPSALKLITHEIIEHNKGVDNIILVGIRSRGVYLAGQATIPRDTACFPAKLSHGHIKALTQMHLDAIFYPCLTYNIDEGLGDNHYNCPVVAYYPEVLAGNCPELEGQKFIYDYVGIHRPKDFVHKMAKDVLPKYFGGISEKEVQEAANAAYAEYYHRRLPESVDTIFSNQHFSPPVLIFHNVTSADPLPLHRQLLNKSVYNSVYCI